jgi:glyoxylase-like metal-dependent hydrolase (beta-lactamase superfamily II)
MPDASLLPAPRPESLAYLDIPPPPPGQTARVAPGVHWIRMPLPMQLDHINLWLIEHADGAVLVDTGLAADMSRGAWEALEQRALREQPLGSIVLTHVHPDHTGLAAWLQARHRVPVWASQETEQQMRRLFEPGEEHLPARLAFLRAHGLEPPEELRPSLSGARYRAAVSGLPHIAYHPREPEEVRWNGERWRWLETDGHARGHLCLHAPDARVLISGDQILPAISPNVSLAGPGGDPDPLRSYLESLERLAVLEPTTLVLPSHGRPFVGVQPRARELIAHHERQLQQLLVACNEPRTAHDTLRVLFRRTLAGFHLLLALGEAIAHLEYLTLQGRLQRIAGADERIRYVRS